MQDEILMMKVYSMLNSNGNKHDLLRCIETIVPIRLTKIDLFSDYDNLTIVQIKALIMYTVILRNLGNVKKANSILQRIISTVEDRKDIKGYGGVYVSVILQKAELLLVEKSYNDAFKFALSLYEYQVNYESYEKLGHTLEILAECLEERGEVEESNHHYRFAEAIDEIQRMHEIVIDINRKYVNMWSDNEKNNHSG